jgi:hypothetical protein
MNNLIEILKSFNRKERFHLVKMILGGFKVSDEFRTLLKIHGIEIPKDHFAAMDYHIDWIYASLVCCFEGRDEKSIFKNDGRISASQEDIDFLIAYKDSQDKYNLVFLEAKGVTGWSNDQIESKWGGSVISHSFILSPKEPSNLEKNSKWFNKWIHLDMGPSILKFVARCDNNGIKSRTGTNWKVEYEHTLNQ